MAGVTAAACPRESTDRQVSPALLGHLHRELKDKTCQRAQGLQEHGCALGYIPPRSSARPQGTHARTAPVTRTSSGLPIHVAPLGACRTLPCTEDAGPVGMLAPTTCYGSEPSTSNRQTPSKSGHGESAPNLLIPGQEHCPRCLPLVPLQGFSASVPPPVLALHLSSTGSPQVMTCCGQRAPRTPMPSLPW